MLDEIEASCEAPESRRRPSLRTAQRSLLGLRRLLTGICGECPGLQVVIRTQTDSFASTTPSQHTYPNSPLQNGCYVGTPFDASTAPDQKHNAQGIKSSGIAVGTPVYGAEGGTVSAAQSGIAHDPKSDVNKRGTSIPQWAGLGDTADYVWITGSDGAATKYYHVTPTVTNGQKVNAGDKIGTVEVSGCSSGAHVHGTARGQRFEGQFCPDELRPQSIQIRFR